jgi:hypothetical protein
MEGTMKKGTKGIGSTITYVSNSNTLERDERAKLYRFGYVVLTYGPQKEPIYVHLLSNSSTLIDNYTRQISHGDKFLYGEPVLDYPRNKSGNATDGDD